MATKLSLSEALAKFRELSSNLTDSEQEQLLCDAIKERDTNTDIEILMQQSKDIDSATSIEFDLKDIQDLKREELDAFKFSQTDARNEHTKALSKLDLAVTRKEIEINNKYRADETRLTTRLKIAQSSIVRIEKSVGTSHTSCCNSTCSCAH